ncbi:MAG: glycosyltransferase family 39 protein [Acidimicrobiales bacterium]
MTDTAVEARPRPPQEVPGPALPPLRKGPVFGIALATVGLELAVSARYGYHRDELYFLACARHLAWGYVDQPPLVPFVAWLSPRLFGASVVSLRVFPAVASAATVVLTALTARELGGRWRAQVLAALAAATSPELLAAFHLLSTTAFDILLWSAITLLVVRLLRTGNERLWLAVGAVTGVTLMDKFNVAFLVVGLGAGLILGGRCPMLRSPWLWTGCALALAIWSPDIVWNAQHDWAAVAMMHRLHQENSTLGASLAFIPEQLIVVGPVLAVLSIAGFRQLLCHPFGRPLAYAFLVMLVLYAVTGAKPYYLAGGYSMLFAAGGVWAEERLLHRTPAKGVRGWVALMVAGAVVAMPLTLPVLPASALAKGPWEGGINKDLSATVGWPSLVGQIASVADRLPLSERANLVIYAGDYGAAGAVDLYGAEHGLPHAISGDNTYWWWGPAGAENGATTIAVDLPRQYLQTIFTEVTPAGTVATPDGVWTEERGDPIWICRGQEISWAQAWLAARHYG